MIKAAALKAKLKYIDLEAKAKADLKRVKTLQELHIEEAKIEAIQAAETTDFQNTNIYDSKLPQIDKNDYIANYIQTHEHINIKSEPPIRSTSTTNTSIPPVSVSQPVYTAPVNLDEPYTLDWSKGPGLAPSNLNPTAANFVSHSTYTFMTQGEPQTHMAGITTSSVKNTNPPVTFTYGPLNPIPHVAPQTGEVNVVPSEMKVVDIAKSFAEQFQLSRLPPSRTWYLFG